MRAPAWLGELALEPGPPWLGMGTRNLPADGWLVADDDLERDLATKARLLQEGHDLVFAAIDSPAVADASAELLELIVGASGRDADPSLHPLDAAGRVVQEDLCLLVDRDGAHHLDAASLCFPSYWSLHQKLGLPMAEVHGPVAHYAVELAGKVDTFLARLRPDRPVWRRNWSIHDDPTYFLPHPTPPYDGTAPDGLWLRSERQTLRRLERSGVVVFTIRTQQVPLAVLADRPEVARRMAQAIEAWSPELRAYKGDHGALAAAPWLAKR